MKLKLIKGVVIAGRPGLAVGDVFEHPEAGSLIAAGYCEEAKESPEPQEIVTREPEIENRDFKPRKKGK